MNRTIKPTKGISPSLEKTQLHHFHQITANEKRLFIERKKLAEEMKDATKLGSILKRIGGGLSRHRP
ncbi:hypothetical protein [Pseudochrobactrum kiredjianiae]|uniref:Uncharacterized protein n=1 Tax=Pseudochrobactrum kiredjianiae TaxID=386305 RepID=A0ABW3V286_9HYPH|nr:hypothetical protein [Pseudochrobactrum kiredjianiae]MDM7851866.1 hypothetical protein [Pseudochrobactrum kiredjianiae]